MELVQALSVEILRPVLSAEFDKLARHLLHRRRVETHQYRRRALATLVLVRVLVGEGLRGHTTVRAVHRLGEDVREGSAMQRAVGFHRQHFRERLEERARGVGRHGLWRGLRDVVLLTVLLPFLSEHGSRRAAVRLDILFRVASDLDAVASRRHFPEFGDKELGEVKFEAHVHDALLAVSPRDERGAMEALGDVRDDVLGPISVGAVPEEVAGDASHEEEVLVHAMAVDADPLAARGDVEDAGVGESHLVLEFVHEAGHLFGELFLDVPAVRVPHGVEEALPDLFHVEELDVAARAEPLGESGEGGVANVLIAVGELLSEWVLSRLRIGELGDVRLPRSLRDGRRGRELPLEAAHVARLLHVRLDLGLHRDG